MDDETEIYFLDEDDVRNATVRDHRTNQGGGGGSGIIRARPGAGASIPTRVVVRPAGASRPVVVAQPPRRDRVFANLTTGQLLEVASQILAAIQPLPGAPVASGHVPTDVGNLITFQQALATHAKRDEQLRTLGSLVGKLVG